MTTCNKTKENILDLIKIFIKNKETEITIKNKECFIDLVKNTCIGGIIYNVLKNNDKEISSFLKKEFNLIKESDKRQTEVFKILRKLPFEKILLKENSYKFKEEYKLGTRYSCDIDLLVRDKDISKVDKILTKNEFYLNGIDLIKSEDLINLGYKINRDLSEMPYFIDQVKYLIEEVKEKNKDKEINNFEVYINNFIKELNNVLKNYKRIAKKDFLINNNEMDFETNEKEIVLKEKNFLNILKNNTETNIKEAIKEIYKTTKIIEEDLISFLDENKEMEIYNDFFIENIEKNINRSIKIKELPKQEDKDFHYDYKNGAFIDIHFDIFPEYLPFKINIEELNIEKEEENISYLKNEDSIIIDACHFTYNLSKYKNKNAFQGFLKYLIDLNYKLKNDIDWNYLINKSKENNSSSQLSFYLKMAKKIDIEINKKYIKEIKKNGSKIQNILLNLIPSKKLLFNEKSIFCVIYSKMYLEKNTINKYVEKIHHIYNKLLK
jgi:hypothetical protein